MSDPAAGSVRTLVAGIVVVILGVACWAAFSLQAGRERHAYSHGGAPAEYVQLTARHTYWLAVPGGVKHLDQVGVQVSALQCTAAQPGQAPGALSVTPEGSGTKATDQIASFYSAISGRLHIECDRVGAVYVDGAAADPFDWSGLWLILASVLLVIGIPLTLSGRRRLPPPRTRRRDDDDDDGDDDDGDDDGAPSALFGAQYP